MNSGTKRHLGRKPGSPRAIAQEVKDRIYDTAMTERETSREDLAERLIQQIEQSGNVAPTVETTIKYISYARTHGFADMDEPWTVGCCHKYGIPSDIIPDLIELIRKETPLTIREARWFAKLKLTVYEIAKRKQPDASALGLTSLIAGVYARKERLSQIAGLDYANTAEIDELILVNEDLVDGPAAAFFASSGNNHKGGKGK